IVYTLSDFIVYALSDFQDSKYHDIILSENISLHLLELPKVTEKIYARNNKTEWLYFLKHAHEEKEKNMKVRYSNPMIHNAFHLLNDLSSNDEACLQARARERAIFNKRIELGYARKKGLEEAQIAIAKKLKQMGMTDDQISQTTSLDISKIQAIEE
ncbi:ATPase, partial [Candidatus Magnetomorum sp. HK-1]